MTKLFKCDACLEAQSGESYSVYVYSTNSEGKRIVRTADLDLSCFEALRVRTGADKDNRIQWTEKAVERRSRS